MAWLRPRDGPGVVYEFFAPFAHVPGQYEWCRLRSPTHGAFDVFILLGESTSVPARVYVNSPAGARYMSDRYPECEAFEVRPEDLTVEERDAGRTVHGRLRALEGPAREADMVFTSSLEVPKAIPYGGTGKPVWGSGRFTCWGVDLVLHGQADGRLKWADGREENLRGAPAMITWGSFARIAPLATKRVPAAKAAHRRGVAATGRARPNASSQSPPSAKRKPKRKRA